MLNYGKAPSVLVRKRVAYPSPVERYHGYSVGRVQR